MRYRQPRSSTGHDPRLWPVLLLLLVVVLVPTVCLLWFMSRAIENERLAARQTLEAAYRRDLANVQDRLERFWQQRLTALEESPHDVSGAAAFAYCVRSGLADSVGPVSNSIRNVPTAALRSGKPSLAASSCGVPSNSKPEPTVLSLSDVNTTGCPG